MQAEYQYRIRRDSDGSPSIDMQFPGFHPTWAYRTGSSDGSSGDSWEFDLASLGGFDMHFAIPYTLSPDLLETLFMRAVAQFNEGVQP